MKKRTLRSVKKLGKLGRRFLAAHQANCWLEKHREITTPLAILAAHRASRDRAFAELPPAAQLEGFRSEILEALGRESFLFCGDTGLVYAIDGQLAPPVVLIYRRFLLLGLARARARSRAIRARADFGQRASVENLLPPLARR